MMKKTVELKIGKEDIKALKAYLLEEKKPLEGEVLTQFVSLNKTKHLRSQRVKVYEEKYWYAVGDLILVDLKNNKFRLSKDRTEEFDGSVVLRVVEKKSSPALGMDLLELDYEGEGEFKRIFTLLKKKKVSMARPCSLDEQQQAPFSEAEDPREQERALSEKEFQDLRENLLKALEESGDFLFWNGFWIHKSQLVKIKDKDVVKLIRTMEERHALPEPAEGSEAPVVSLLPSLTTEEIRTNQIPWEAPPENNEITDFSINYTLSKHPSFLCVDANGKGKWNLKESFESFKKGKPLFRKLVRFPLTPKSETLFQQEIREFIRKSNKRNPDEAVYVPVTLRELHSGALKLDKSWLGFMEGRREVIVRDGDKSYVAYVYPYEGYLLGLEGFYRSRELFPGVLMALKADGQSFLIQIKRAKRSQRGFLYGYDASTDRFQEEKEVDNHYDVDSRFTLLPGTLVKLYEKTEGLSGLPLLQSMFRNMSLVADGYKRFHYLQAFHLMDIREHTDAKEVLRLLLASENFFQFEEEHGVFFFNDQKEAVPVAVKAVAKEETVSSEDEPIFPQEEGFEETFSQPEEEEREPETDEETEESFAEEEAVDGEDHEVEEAGTERQTSSSSEITKQREKIARRLTRIQGKSHLVENIREVEPVHAKEESAEEQPVSETVIPQENFPPAAVEKDIRNLKPLETREKEEKKKKRPTKAPVSPVPGNKKSERRIREEELEMEEAQREALEALKTGVEVERAEKKGPRVEDETKTVYSDKEKKKKGGLLGEKLGELLKKKE